MASGLVPVTSAVSAVPEFLSEEEGILAPYDDHHGLAEGIAKLHHDPAAFLRMSAAAAERVRRQTAACQVMHSEIALIQGDRP
jgi:glycosyltransferase involved in cell wall biosynthesis